MPLSIFRELEQFVDGFFNSVISIPDVDDGVDRNLNFTCNLTISNSDEIMEEINSLFLKLRGI